MVQVMPISYSILVYTCMCQLKVNEVLNTFHYREVSPHISHVVSVGEPNCFHGLFQQFLQRTLTQSVFPTPLLVVLVVIVTFVELFLHFFRKLLYDDVSVFSKRIVVVKALCDLLDSLH